jgi:hypothetical protein
VLKGAAPGKSHRRLATEVLGVHGLEGLNVRIDLNRKELVSAGPVPAAVAA